MAIINRGNWSFRDPGDDIPDGSVIQSGNFIQAVADTEILVGKTLVINGGNWINVKPQPEWTINGGKWMQKSFCAHLNPDLVERGVIDDEPENCPHVVDGDTIRIDGEVIGTIYQYEDTKLWT